MDLKRFQHEPMTGIEPVASSLPRKRSAPELHRQDLSGKRDSNPPPTAWKAVALPDELFPPKCGGRRIRTSEGLANRFTVCPI